MATYVIGDLQGCFAAFQDMLTAIEFDPAQDRLWLAGDLVNRGENSIGILRWCMAHNDRVEAVLGNHDLHLLAVAEGFVPPHRNDTLAEILDAPDRAEVLDWLRHRPMLHREGDCLLVHAGLLPEWTPEVAESLAHELEQALRGPNWQRFLAGMYGNEPRHWNPALQGQNRLRLVANVMTRLRYLHHDGSLEYQHNCAPADAPDDLLPWFDMPQRQSLGVRILFGHWSSLGLLVRDDVIALDTGCLWGGLLSAIRIEDGALFQVDCRSCRPPRLHG